MYILTHYVTTHIKKPIGEGLETAPRRESKDAASDIEFIHFFVFVIIVFIS